ncbi:MAG: hexose kinase [Vagococcus sp.]
MILTVTMNPSVDISYQIPHLNLNDINRLPITDVRKTAGGKGLNVARVLKQTNQHVGATGVIGGTTGEYIVSECKQANIETHFLEVQGESRNCVAILHDGQQTELLESGMSVSKQDVMSFLTHYETLLQSAELITISGSALPGFPNDLYVKMVDMANKYEKKVILDASGVQLKEALCAPKKPFGIKPNTSELSDLLDIPVLDTKEGIIQALNMPLFHDIPLILVSRGENGGVARIGDQFYDISIPKINVVNPVGSGDSTVAGIAYGLINGYKDTELLAYSMLFGMLNALEQQTGCVDLSKTNQYLPDIQVNRMS